MFSNNQEGKKTGGSVKSRKSMRLMALSPNPRLTIKHSLKTKFEKISCLKHYQRKEFLGKGAWGQVFVACKNRTDCKYAVKLTAIRDPSDLVYATKDAYFLKMLQGKKMKGKRVVPAIREFWYCPKQYCTKNACKDIDLTKERGVSVLVVEKFDKQNMLDYSANFAQKMGLSYENPKDEVLLYRWHQLVRMYQLCVYLGKKRIVWSDCKPDQFLYKAKEDLLVANDFGFAGSLDEIPYSAEPGWCSNEKHPPFFGACSMNPLQIKTVEEAVLYNVWQLEAWLIGGGHSFLTFVTMEPKSQDKKMIMKKLKLFTGIKWGPKWSLKLQHLLKRICPSFWPAYNEVIDKWNQDYEPKNRVQLDFDSLLKIV